MKKRKSVISSILLFTMLLTAGVASANETQDLPVDEGIVIETSTTNPADTSTTIDNSAEDTSSTGEATMPDELVTGGDAGVSSADGNNLPLDQGDATTAETGTEEAVVAPKEDAVTLTEEPVVEELPKTGLADYGMLMGALLAALAAIGYFFTRKTSVQ